MMFAEIHNTKITVFCLSCGNLMKASIGDLMESNTICDKCKGVYDEAQDKDTRD
jgi:hypothetical protein